MEKEIDDEWIKLISLAKEMNISIEDIRKFIETNSKLNRNT